MSFVGSLILIVVCGVLLGAVIAIAIAISAARGTAELKRNLATVPNFVASQEVMGCDGASGLAIDESGTRLCLLRKSGDDVSSRVVSYRDIVSVELFEDGSSISKTVRSSQLGGAVIGGLALGGIGAVVGGLSGKTETVNRVRRVDLRIVVAELNEPLHDVPLLNVQVDKGGLVHSQVLLKARRWHGIVSVLVKRAEEEAMLGGRLPVSAGTDRLTPSIADELKKLADLHNSGVLTAGEFQQQKTALLRANGDVS